MWYELDPEAWQAIYRYLARLGTGLLVLLVAWVLSGIAYRVIERLTPLRKLDPGLTAFFSSTARYTLLFVGVISALGTFGVDVTALVAGLGLTGFALGFAMKELISNALSGMLLLIYKPFRFGDQIVVTELAGTVVEINMRYTVLDAGEQKIHIPNTNLFTNPVKVKKRGAEGVE